MPHPLGLLPFTPAQLHVQRRARPTRARSQAGQGDEATTSGRDSDAPAPPSRPPSQPAPPRPSVGNAVQTVQWGGTLPSGRRALVGGLTGLGIVLVGNLFGVSSFLLGLGDAELGAALRLDVLIPVRGYRRCVDYGSGYEFLYPAAWLADQRLYRRYAARVESPIDPPSLRDAARMRARQAAEPSAAFGPAGGSGEENISVIVAPIREGFRLQGMGSPEQAAADFLANTVAPPGSDRVAELLGASSRVDAAGELYYTMEFTVSSPRFARHNLAAYAARNGLLYTLNCQCAERDWGRDEAAFRRAADSFSIISSGAGTAGFPDRL